MVAGDRTGPSRVDRVADELRREKAAGLGGGAALAGIVQRDASEP
jgi:hypothetical protein